MPSCCCPATWASATRRPPPHWWPRHSGSRRPRSPAAAPASTTPRCGASRRSCRPALDRAGDRLDDPFECLRALSSADLTATVGYLLEAARARRTGAARRPDVGRVRADRGPDRPGCRGVVRRGSPLDRTGAVAGSGEARPRAGARPRAAAGRGLRRGGCGAGAALGGGAAARRRPAQRPAAARVARRIEVADRRPQPRLAVGTLTAIPVPPPRVTPGVAPGRAAAGSARGHPARPPSSASSAGRRPTRPAAARRGFVALGALALGSRALHLDGLSDVADGLTASYDRERSLAVMKGGTAGPAGVAALVIVLGTQAAALATYVGERAERPGRRRPRRGVARRAVAGVRPAGAPGTARRARRDVHPPGPVVFAALGWVAWQLLAGVVDPVRGPVSGRRRGARRRRARLARGPALRRRHRRRVRRGDRGRAGCAAGGVRGGLTPHRSAARCLVVASQSRSTLPATTRCTSSQPAATRWLTVPSRSRNSRPERWSGTTPRPTSLVTSTIGSEQSASAAATGVEMAADVLLDLVDRRLPQPGPVDHRGEPGAEAVHQHRSRGRQRGSQVGALQREPGGGSPGAVPGDPRGPVRVVVRRSGGDVRHDGRSASSPSAWADLPDRTPPVTSTRSTRLSRSAGARRPGSGTLEPDLRPGRIGAHQADPDLLAERQRPLAGHRSLHAQVADDHHTAVVVLLVDPGDHPVELLTHPGASVAASIRSTTARS